MNRYNYSHGRRDNPSFSSTLLDAIYRSIDESSKTEEEELVVYREATEKKQEESASFQRVCMIEKWMDKKESRVSVSVSCNRPSTTTSSVMYSSSSSNSDSSSGFSSSEAESLHGNNTMQQIRPKPIRTSVSIDHEDQKQKINKEIEKNFQNQNQEEGFVKNTKSRGLRIYGDLKKAKKQPVSPGAKLASFLNSIFSGQPKKAKFSSSSSQNRARSFYEDEDSKKESKFSVNNYSSSSSTTCSSASSFSRSCLSKSSRSSNMKRCVRFYDPISVVVDEEESKKQSMEARKEIRNSINEELKLHIMEKNQRVEEAARDLFRSYQKRVELNEAFHHINGEDDDDDDDGDSCASSDLFELDNLSAIGMADRYREELPVYETTRLDTNRAIAKRMVL